MKLRVCVALLSVATAVALYAADAPKQAAPSAEEKAAMDAMMKAATPGEAHKKLDAMVGTWDSKVKMWMAPGAPPAESGGTSVNQWVLGGRYLEQRFTGNFMGMPYSGLGYTGYDNVKQQYFGTYMDNMGTGVSNSTGKMDGANRWTFTGSMPDPVTGKDAPFEQHMVMTDNDHVTFDMWSPGPDGKMAKIMEITYVRKK
jgi:Protein of unknown function (DUF1579)